MTRRVVKAEVNLRHAEQVAIDAAEAAGKILLDGAQYGFTLQQKDLLGDVVTDLDVAAERAIVDRLRVEFPSHQVIAEEAGVSGADNETWTWFVDPLDGTNNLAIGLPAFVVGLALCADGRPVVGVVHEPLSQRTWSTVRGDGKVRRSGTEPQITRSARSSLAPVVAWTQGHSVARNDVVASALKVVLDSSARRVLQLWAPLLGWVMLARGDIDGIIGYQAEAVDLPAGVLLAREAGMVIQRLDGTEFDDQMVDSPASRSFVAARPECIRSLTHLVMSAQRVEADVRRMRLAAEPYGELSVKPLPNGRSGASPRLRT
ncbi:MAG TPA: inositol monophosphatase [Micromonosporaceae bacterium]|nr:inositol monophosphatase [Micromonosporaceae bacterium]